MKIHQTFRLKQEVIQAAQKCAEKENRTISNFYETAVIEYLKLKDQKVKKQRG